MTCNDARICDGSTYIALTDRAGNVVAEAVGDSGEASWVLAFGRWRRSGAGYVCTTRFEDGKRRDVYLHRILTSSPAGMVVDHINGNTLDNRLVNLRVLQHAENMQNQKCLRSDSTTGVRNVSVSSSSHSSQRYKVVIGGVYFGRFSDLMEAKKVADGERSKVLRYAEN